MTNTETEAKTKWCPKARPSENIGDYERGDKWIAGANRDGLGGVMSATRCIASECMAWRWLYEHFESGGLPPEQCGRTEGDWERLSQHDWRRPTGRGFCGLAGAP